MSFCFLFNEFKDIFAFYAAEKVKNDGNKTNRHGKISKRRIESHAGFLHALT